MSFPPAIPGGQRATDADTIDVEAFLPDRIRTLREGEHIDDDLIRGACPGRSHVGTIRNPLAQCSLRSPIARNG